MTTVSSAIPNLINGVSQQPDAMRLSSQGEAQQNAYPSVVEGLKKRGGTYHVTKLTSSLLEGAHVHTIRRDADEEYKLILTDGGIMVFDVQGNVKTVASPDGLGYLGCDTPATDLACMTIADYTFIVNKTIECAMGAATSPVRDSEGIAFFIQSTNNTTYTIEIDGQEYAYDNGNASGNGKSQADHMAEMIHMLEGTPVTYGTEKVNPGPLNSATYGWRGEETTLHIWRKDGQEMEFKAYCSRSNTCLEGFKNSTQRFSELPTVAPEGFTLEVKGDNTSSFDNYFVKFAPDSGDFGKGSWKECVKPGIVYQFDASTMPHVLVREADGSFTFKEAEWAERKVGDENTAPEPTFVGRTINHCLFYRNRLGFLSDENLVMSEATGFFNFWPTTMTTLVDSDPIDVPAGSSRVAILNHAVAFGEDLILFSDLDQFVLDYEDVLSPKTADIKPITSFENSPTVRPVNSGKNVFFAVDRGKWAGLQEYYVDNDSGSRDAVDVTSHVPKYIPGPMTTMAVSTNENVLACLTAADPNAVYLYKYFWSGNDKVQSAWGRWEFSGKVLDVDFSETDLYLVVQHSDGTYLEWLSVQPGYAEENAPIEYHLDRKITEAECSVSFDAGTGLTTWTLPYTIDADMAVVTRFLDEASPYNPGERLVTTATVGTPTITAVGDYTDAKVIIGEDYGFRYRFSQQTIKEAVDSGGKAVVGLGRLVLRHWMILFDETGYFQANVTPLYRDTSTYTFTGRVLGSGNNILGAVPLESGKFKFPVMAKNYEVTIEITNDSFLPCRFISADWEGNFIIRSKRV